MKELFQNRKLLLYGVVMFMIYFTYLFVALNPALYLIKSYREFFTNAYFLKQYFSFPGDPVEYVSRFITQFYCYPALASFFIAVIVLLVYWLGVSAFKSGNRNYYLPLVPALFLMVMHNDYGHDIKFDVNLLCLFAASWVYFQNLKKPLLLNFLLFCSLFAAVLFFNGFVVSMLFGVLALLSVFIFRREKANLISIFVGVFGVYLLFHFLFFLSFHDLKQELVDTLRIYSFPLLPFIFYLSVPVVFIFYNKWDISKIDLVQRSRGIRTVISYPFLVLSVLLILFLTMKSEQRKVLLVQHYALENNWNKVLEYSAQCHLADRNVACCTNEALYRTGKIYNELFHYFQGFGADGLMSTEEITDYSQIVPNQNIFLQLGALSLSVVWGVEASNVYGANPYVLKSLTKAYLAEGEIKEASKMLNLLDHSLFTKNWVAQYRKFVRDTTLIENDPELGAYRRSQLPEALVYSHNETMNLYLLSRTSTTNKMAYDYLLISTMLDHQMENFASCLSGMKSFGYQSIPNLFFEGIVYLSLYTDQIPVNMDEFSFDQTVLKRFGAFRQKLTALKNNREKARKELFEEFGDTYWYYLLYKSPVSERQRGDAFARLIL